ALLWENAAGQSRAYTYAQLDALSNRLASALARLGVRFGDRVFLRLPNRPEFYLAALAVAKLGGVFIPSSTQFRDAEVRYRLNDPDAPPASSPPPLAAVSAAVRADCPPLRPVTALDEDGGPVSGHRLDFNALVAQGVETFTPAATRHDDLAFLAYTSGTTGD